MVLPVNRWYGKIPKFSTLLPGFTRQLGMSKSTLSLDSDEETRLLSYTVYNSFRHSGLKVTYVSERIWIWDDVEYD